MDDSEPARVRDPKFPAQNTRLRDIWDLVQQLQSDLCFPQEIGMYYQAPSWHTARSVLDVGTGNGYFIDRLARRFPEKQYTAIDTSPDFVELADARLQRSPVTVECRDYFEESGAYDFVVTRLFWQHVPSFKLDLALSRLSVLTRRHGSVLVMDAHDANRLFSPELPKFRDVIQAYSHRETAEGRCRDVCDVLVSWAERADGWTIGYDATVIIPSAVPGYLEIFRHLYNLWLDLFEAIGELKLDFAGARAEIAEAFASPSMYTQVGMRLLRLDREG